MKYLTYLAIFLAMVCGMIFPGLGSHSAVVVYLVGFLLLLNFLEIQVEWRRFLRKELLVTMALTTIVMPLLVYHVLAVGLMEEYRIGLLLTAIAPAGIMTLVMGRFMPEKDYNLILANFLTSQFGCILYIPLIVRVLLGTVVRVNTLHLFLQICALILLPYACGALLRGSLSAGAINRVRRWARAVMPVVIFFIILLSISKAAEQMVWESSLLRLAPLVLAVFVLQGGLAYLAGVIFWSRGVRNSLALTASSRNVALMVGIGTVNFSPLVVVPCVLGIIFHHLTNAGWLWLFRE